MADTPAKSDLREHLKTVAQRSGKPLEVVVARSFLENVLASEDGKQHPWKVYLGSYFEDGAGEKVRELDVLARRQRFVDDGKPHFTCTLEAVVSCKGFPDDEHPITFTIEQPLTPRNDERPLLLSQFGQPPTRNLKLSTKIAEQAIARLAGASKDASIPTRRTVGFDIAKDPRKPKQEWTAKGDRTLFEGLDSALRASMYWASQPLPAFHSSQEWIVRTQVPILVLSRPWHAFSIDDGVIKDPVETSVGFLSNLYPAFGPGTTPRPMLTLLVARSKLSELQDALVKLYVDMWDLGETALKGPL